MKGGWSPELVRIFKGKVAAPTVTDDMNSGFRIGDLWIDETADVSYRLVDASVGAAVWDKESAEAATTAAAGVVELATVAEAVAGSDTSRAITAEGLAAYVATVKNPPVNLLSNAGFGVWSNSTLENVRALPDSTSTVVDTTVTSTAHLLTVGMLVKDAAGTPLVFEVITAPTADTFTVDRAGGTDGQWYEVTPGCVAADSKGPDNWIKDTTLDAYREHNGSNTKNGAFYSIKLVPSSIADYLQFPAAGSANAEHYKKFAGRIVTFGAWVKSSTSDDIEIDVHDGITPTASSRHTGSGEWEWLEVTKTCSVSATAFYARIIFRNAAPGTAYVSQPMLVFGSKIGEGNYLSPQDRVVWFETNKDLTGYTSASPGALTSSNATLNLEALSSGVVPKGVRAVYCILYGKATAAEIIIQLDANTTPVLRLYTQVANILNSVTGTAICDVSGNLRLYTNGTASGIVILVQGVQLRS